MISVKHLEVGSRLHPVSFKCPAGSFLHVVGPNGSGKSTLLSALAGMIPYQGQICIGSVDVSETDIQTLAAIRAFLSQNDRPVFAVDVYHYLALSVPVSMHAPLDEVSAVIHYLARRLKLEDKLGSSVHQISGGEWQRVRLAGSCLQIWPSVNPQAQLLILDEPAAALDVGQEALMYDLLHEVRETGVSVVMANHDLNRTYTHASQVILLNQGNLYRTGLPAEVLNEETIKEVFQANVQTIDIQGKYYLLFD